MKELETINQLALRKSKSETGSQMKVSDDTLQQIIALEDRIKQSDKKTEELKKSGATVQSQLIRTRTSAEQAQANIEHIKDVTGWDRHNYASRGFSNESNRFKQHQKSLAALEEKQNTAKVVTTGLTKKIEELSAELEALKSIDEEIATAKAMLLQTQSEKSRVEDETKSVQRIHFRKEKLATKAPSQDDYKSIKLLEGDKRVLHTELMKTIEAKKANERSIQAQDQRMRHIEVRLEAIAGFLRAAFEGEEDSQDHREGAEEGATSVPLAMFEEIQNSLVKARKVIVLHDEKLDKLDADIEINEKKSTVLQHAIVARTAHAARENQDKERGRLNWADQMEGMQQEFEVEYERLTQENDELRNRIAQL
eukprot:GILJ01021186.1.p1 GENE.GILJ01021186.1~~GILJ01021186.1.p1  ORF type:complete len:367 (-),score=86.38 GILJ01021186.1:78-1178(-)